MAIGGFQKMREMREQSQAAFSRDETPELKLFGGEKARGWLIGGDAEPYLYLAHGVQKVIPGRKKPKYLKIPCAAPEPCLLCDQVSGGSASIKRASDHAAFSFFDVRYMAKAPLIDQATGKPVIVQNGDRKGQPFMVDKPCLPKTQGAVLAGLKAAAFSTRYAETLDGVVVDIAQKCSTCWTAAGTDDEAIGVIEHVSWVCPHCATPRAVADHEYRQPFTCRKCKKEGVSREVISCSNECEKPRRTGMGDGPWEITKTGSEKSTNYNFVFVGVREPPAMVVEAEPLNLKKIYAGWAPKRVAAFLKIPNTHGGGAMANTTSYEDELPPEDDEGDQIHY